MTSPSPPDISSLTLSSQRSQQRPNENYDTYDGRTPYHFQTSPPIIPGGGQNLFNTTQGSPAGVKKGSRAGLPSVSPLNVSSLLSHIDDHSAMARQRCDISRYASSVTPTEL